MYYFIASFAIYNKIEEMGGGILPVALHDNEVFLLFGKENELDDTQGWADFGGGRKKKESILQTAIREGCEELNGFLGLEHEIRENYHKNKVLSVNHESYTTFMYKVDYDSNMPKYFRGNYMFLSSRLPQIKGNLNNGLLEKSHIKWYTFQELRNEKGKFRPFYQAIVEKIIGKEEEIKDIMGVEREEKGREEKRKPGSHSSKRRTRKHRN